MVKNFIFFFKLETQNFKNLKQSFGEKKSFKGFKSDLREDQRFESLAAIGSHVSGNEKKNVKKSKTQNFKNPNQYFMRTTQKKIQKKMKSF